MLKAAEALTILAKESKHPENISSAMRAWIMNLQAAAIANDRETYVSILEKMEAMHLIVDHFLENTLCTLQRTFDRNDYLSWGFALVRLAAARMGDDATYLSVAIILESSQQSLKGESATWIGSKEISHEKKIAFIAESLLAELTARQYMKNRLSGPRYN